MKKFTTGIIAAFVITTAASATYFQTTDSTKLNADYAKYFVQMQSGTCIKTNKMFQVKDTYQNRANILETLKQGYGNSRFESFTQMYDEFNEYNVILVKFNTGAMYYTESEEACDYYLNKDKRKASAERFVADKLSEYKYLGNTGCEELSKDALVSNLYLTNKPFTIDKIALERGSDKSDYMALSNFKGTLTLFKDKTTCNRHLNIVNYYETKTLESIDYKHNYTKAGQPNTPPYSNSNTITHNGTTYGTVTSPFTGKIWLDRNLGAKRVCQSYNDKQCYGDYYQWGRDADGHEKQNSSSFTKASNAPYEWKSSDSSGSQRQNFWSKTDGSGVCPKGFRVPTIDELETETVSNGVKNSNDAFKNFLKLPSAGYRYYDSGSLSKQGSGGGVWASSPYVSAAWSLSFDSFNAYTYKYGGRAYGFSVRCLKE